MHARLLRAAVSALSLTLLALSGCGGDKAATYEEYKGRVVTFPNKVKIRAEVASHPKDVTRGMQFRDSLAPDAGMLFIHGKQGSWRYWMYQVRIPLDIIWLDRDGKITQIVHKAPPCPGPPETCMNYGGAFPSLYVLELPAGTAAKNNLKPGQTLEF